MHKVSKILIMSMALVFCSALAALADQVSFTEVDANHTKVTLEQFKPDNNGSQEFQTTWKQITNQTGQTWTDYHLALDNPPHFYYNGFDYPITVTFDAPGGIDKGLHDTSTSTSTELNFKAKDTNDLVVNGDKFGFNDKITLSGFPTNLPSNAKIDYTFEIVQYPSTAVPLPGAVLLLGAGMARLAAYARRRKED